MPPGASFGKTVGAVPNQFRSTMKIVWLIVRGICGDPADCEEWEQHSADWIHQDPYCQSRGFIARADSYSCSFVTVAFRESARVKSFAKVLKGYLDAGFQVYGLCHSNGTRIWRGALQQLNWPRVEQLHFVNGACDSDFRRTGFNQALKRNKIGTFHYYVGGCDIAMLAENTFLGRLDFAVPEKSCPMGLKGPQHVDPSVASRVIEGSKGWEHYGHSTAWDSKHFNDTMLRVTGQIVLQTPARVEKRWV